MTLQHAVCSVVQSNLPTDGIVVVSLRSLLVGIVRRSGVGCACWAARVLLCACHSCGLNRCHRWNRLRQQVV
ncbi:hypothetical protein MRX96_055718 [Rhipicephalus microplus]